MSAKELNAQQAAFAQLLAEGMGKAEAYRAVYPGNYTARSCATKAGRLARHPLIAALGARRAAAVLASVDRAVERYGITSDRVADAMARLAFTDLRDIVGWKTVNDGGKARLQVNVRDDSAISGDAHQAIAELKRTAGGEVSVKLFNKREALMDLARLKGWIADKPVDQRQLVMLKIER